MQDKGSCLPFFHSLLPLFYRCGNMLPRQNRTTVFLTQLRGANFSLLKGQGSGLISSANLGVSSWKRGPEHTCTGREEPTRGTRSLCLGSRVCASVLRGTATCCEHGATRILFLCRPVCSTCAPSSMLSSLPSSGRCTANKVPWRQTSKTRTSSASQQY